MAYGKARDPSLPDWGEIVSIYLLPEHFGKGYGSVLLKHAGYEDAYLWVWKDNKPARLFYEKINGNAAAMNVFVKSWGKN